MENRIKVLTWLLVASLVLNIYSIYRIGNLERTLPYSVSNKMNNMVQMLRNDISGLYRNIEEIRQESKWVLSREFTPNQEASSPGELHLDLEWSFSELEKGAHVSLLYRDKDQPEEWAEVSAANKGTNIFSAPLVLSPEKEYEYQLVSEGQIVRVDEAMDIPPLYYQPAPLTIGGSGAASTNGELIDFQVSFKQREPVLFDFYRVKNVEARIYRDNQSKNIKLGPDEHAVYSQSWTLSFDREDLAGDITAVILEVEYEDGTVEEKNFTSEILETMSRMKR